MVYVTHLARRGLKEQTAGDRAEAGPGGPRFPEGAESTVGGVQDKGWPRGTLAFLLVSVLVLAVAALGYWERDTIRQSLEDLQVPDGMGCIVRTAGIGRTTEELKWDLDYLLRVWEAIKQVVVTRPSPFVIYQEGNAIVRALRDYFSNDIGEILIDNPNVY